MIAQGSAWAATHAAAASLGALLVLLTPLRPAHLPLRSALQAPLIRTVQRQLPWVAWVQRCTHPVIDTLVFASAVTVTVEWYLSFLPLLVWCGQVSPLP